MQTSGKVEVNQWLGALKLLFTDKSIKLRMKEDLNVIDKTKKLIEENIGLIFYDLGLGCGILDKT